MDREALAGANGAAVMICPAVTVVIDGERRVDPAAAVTALYAEHALGLTRHRRWDKLRDPAKTLPYVRSAVLNGCRIEFRRTKAALGHPGHGEYEAYLPPAWSAESAALASEERREVLRALLRLHRQHDPSPARDDHGDRGDRSPARHSGAPSEPASPAVRRPGLALGALAGRPVADPDSRGNLGGHAGHRRGPGQSGAAGRAWAAAPASRRRIGGEASPGCASARHAPVHGPRLARRVMSGR